MDVKSSADCQTLIRRIHETLEVERPELTSRIDGIAKEPPHLLGDDARIFEKLCLAILTANTCWDDIDKNKAEIRRALFDWDIDGVARLSDLDIKGLYKGKIAPLNIGNPKEVGDKLRWIRDDARILDDIQRHHGSVWQFVTELCKSGGTDSLIECFAYGRGKYQTKLRGVRLAICCEFLKGIGFDELKPDRHIIRFFKRTRLMKNNRGVAETEEQQRALARRIGITIANNIASEEILQPRKYVDALIWNLCATKRGQICTQSNPQRGRCRLYTETPRFCECPDYRS